MRIRKILFLSIFLILGLVLFMPNTVNATGVIDNMGFIIYEHNEVKLKYEKISDTEVKVFDREGTPNAVVIPSEITLNDGTTKYKVTGIGHAAFANFHSLTNITIPNTVTEIESAAFAECINLSSITIPNSVQKIEYGAFGGCTNLKTVILSNQLTEITDMMFIDCINLSSVTIPSSVQSIAADAFEGCTSLGKIYGYKDSYAYYYAYDNGIPFEEISYTLTFDANGGKYNDNTTVQTITLKASEKITALEVPMKKDYIFGEFVDENGKNLNSYISGEAKFYDGMKFKAEWIELVDNKVIDFTNPIDLSEYESILLDILDRKVIEMASDYIKDASGKMLATNTTDGKYVSVDNLTVSDNISYTYEEFELNTIAGYNNQMFVGKITEIPRKIELIFSNLLVNVIQGNNAILDGTKAHIISIKSNGNSMTSIEYKLKGENQYKTLEKDKDYTIESPVEIALTPDFLKTLSDGEYELVVNYSSNAKANVTFTIDKSQEDNKVDSGLVTIQPTPEQSGSSQSNVGSVQEQSVQTNNPKTGDTITLWIGVLVISLSGLVLIKKKK